MPTAVYAAEIADGVADLVRGSNRVAFAGLAQPREPFAKGERSLTLLEGAGIARGTNLNQVDLFYMESVLATTGLNLNDDYFERLEAYAARGTPEDKQLNYEHNRDDIIGHMTASKVVGADGAEVAEGTAVDELPDKFHIVNSAVLYRLCDDKERQKRTDLVIAEIGQGKWCVSMEALFTSFDYLLVPPGEAEGSWDLSKARIVLRNEQTAFLTKHLRAYKKGTGVYNGEKVGRVLRNITFAGVGLVRNPANPESVILSCASEFSSGRAPIFSSAASALGYGTSEPESRATKNDEESAVATEIETLKAQVADLTGKLEKTQSDLQAVNAKQLEKQLDTAKAEAQTAKDAAAKAEQAAKDAEAKASAEKAKADEALKARDAAVASLTEVREQARAEKRLAAVKAAYEYDDAQASEYLKTLATVDDAAFDAVIAAQTKTNDYLKAKTAEFEKATKLGESKVSDKPAPMAGKPTKVGGVNMGGGTTSVPAPTITTAEEQEAEGADASAIAEATPEKAAALAAAGTSAADVATAAVAADIAAYFSRADKNDKPGGRGKGRNRRNRRKAADEIGDDE